MACARDSEKPPLSSIFVGIEPHDRICILRCVGRFVSGPQIEYMQSKLNEVKCLGCRHVLADFHQVSAIGSMGLGFLVGLYTSIVCQNRGRFVVAGASPQVRTVLDLTHLDTVIQLAPDLASGLKLLGAGVREPEWNQSG
jgi:anti-anti-sigma factor